MNHEFNDKTKALYHGPCTNVWKVTVRAFAKEKKKKRRVLSILMLVIFLK